jgi:hypothetical protein
MVMLLLHVWILGTTSAQHTKDSTLQPSQCPPWLVKHAMLQPVLPKVALGKHLACTTTTQAGLPMGTTPWYAVSDAACFRSMNE